MSVASVLARGKAALRGSETEQRLAVLLYDDSVQVISTFELNQLASLTYHESMVITSSTDMTEILLDNLEQIQKSPIQYSTISVQKCLVVTEHILLYGAEKVIACVRQQLLRYIQELTEYNTVLLSAQHESWLFKLKGGGVDQGGPVREIAQRILSYFPNNHQLLYAERQRLASNESLVPIGDKQQVGFCTDKVRYEILQRKIRQQNALKSNLKKDDNAFGAGYASRDGKTVVGAAHGIEEMLAMQKKHEQKFRDDSQTLNEESSNNTFQEYQAPDLLEFATLPNTTAAVSSSSIPPSAIAPVVDLLDLGTSPLENGATIGLDNTADMLLWGSNEENSVVTSTEIFNTAATTTTIKMPSDPFDAITSTITTATDTNQRTNADAVVGDLALLAGSMSLHQPLYTTNNNGIHSTSSHLWNNTSSIPVRNNTPTTTTTKNTYSLAPTDPFDALDGLTTTSAIPQSRMTALGVSAPPPVPSASFVQGTPAWTGSVCSNTMSIAPQVPLPPTAITSSIQISAPLAPLSGASGNKDDDDNGFGMAMGGAMGMGLQPVGSAPAAPPPPPPPPSNGSFFY
jgi:hypothetical protein